MKPDPIRAIADAVLYEGYILWPYRRSALKNQRRFTFGGVYPPAHSERHPDDAHTMQSEVLLRADPQVQVQVQVSVRYLHVVARTAARRRGEEMEPVDELVVDGERHQSWEEAVERTVEPAPIALDQLRTGYTEPIAVPAGSELEGLRDRTGEVAGALIRSWKELQGELRLSATPLADDLWRLGATIANTTRFGSGDDRQRALAQTFCSTHTLLHAPRGSFVSLTDPPEELEAEAAACRNVGTWPVLVGEASEHGTMLSSPIILEDHPRIAPESPGDLFDGGEIDQLLILSILSMTEDERAEMAASDPRAREILERTEALSTDQLMALHGTVRELGMVR
ncbi:MAG: hypothetical protein M3Z27_09730 [Actinomycetota bacterium]|nr:hypothetical protein [Actinomycetota bacterium]